MLLVNVAEYNFFVLIVKPTPEMLSSNAVFWILYVIEICALLFAFCTVPKLVWALERTPLYHKNLIRITQITLTYEFFVKKELNCLIEYFYSNSKVKEREHGGLFL
uniref:Uncharacterized protein n=1 Tax=Angiostrongylus cantonensis TaxID=6313 RepID=A0A0K0D4B7_ANGCA